MIMFLDESIDSDHIDSDPIDLKVNTFEALTKNNNYHNAIAQIGVYFGQKAESLLSK